jgi:hypothetical protein
LFVPTPCSSCVDPTSASLPLFTSYSSFIQPNIKRICPTRGKLWIHCNCCGHQYHFGHFPTPSLSPLSRSFLQNRSHLPAKLHLPQSVT